MKKKLLSLLLVMVMIVGMIPITAFAAAGDASAFSDMPNDWSTTALKNAVTNSLLGGYGGKIMPKDNLTRAQMAVMVNRAFGTTEKVTLSSYTDVSTSAWYYDDMAKAVQMKTFIGYGGKLNPDKSITREEAFVVLANAFKLSGANASALDKFSDKDLVSKWAKDGTASLVNAGYIAGSNGRINPKQNITRAEFAQIMDNVLKNYIKNAGTYTSNLNGNVMINVPNVTLKGMKITGDLIIGDGVGNGDVTLDGVTVTGRTVIRGGGINSIKIIGNTALQNIIIARVDGELRVYAEDGTQIGETIVDGYDNVTVEGCVGIVTVAAPDVTVIANNADIVKATIENNRSIIIVREGSTLKTGVINGEDGQIITSKGAKIGNVIVNGDGATLSGDGTITTVEANANNIKVTTQGTKVIADEGTIGVLAGTVPVVPGEPGTVGGIPVVPPTTHSRGNRSIAANASIVTAIGLVPTTKTVVEGTDTNLLTMLNAISGMNATGVTLTLDATGNANVANDGTITYTGSEVVGDVIVKINKTDGIEQTVTVAVTVPAHTPTAAELANASIVTAIGLVPTTKTVVEGTDINLLTMLNAISGMNATGVTLTLDATGNANVANDGTITYTGSEVVGDVIVKINKTDGIEQTVTVAVTVPMHIATVAAKGLVPTTKTVVEETDTNLLTMLNAISGMNATGVTLTLDATGNANVANDGTITYTGSEVVGNVIVKINKIGEIEQTVTVAVTVPAHTLAVGDAYGGGKIAYILKSGDPGYSATVQHGLIAATVDQSTGSTWSNIINQSIGVSARGTAIGTGNSNTTAIIGQSGHTGSAASICDAYTNADTGTGVYSDWYLPSKIELYKLLANKEKIGLNDVFYWSSSEYDSTQAIRVHSSSGASSSEKSVTAYVRAIRAF